MDAEKLYYRMREALREEQVILHPDMREHTSFKAGGRAAVMALPSSGDDVTAAVNICKESDTDYIVIGNGTNLLVRDEGFDGAVIKMGKDFSAITVKDSIITAEAGALLSAAAKAAQSNSLTGFEFAGGIPGSVGGATLMNAGAYGGEMKDIIDEITYLAEDGEICTIPGSAARFSYRHSIFEDENSVILKTVFRLEPGNRDEIAALMKELTAKRNAKQPVSLPSAGSTFKRPEGHFAGRLIEDAGLKGTTVGGASVSQLHAGFIVNEGGATAQDILDLIKLVQYTVFDKYGVMLEPEVKILPGR